MFAESSIDQEINSETFFLNGCTAIFLCATLSHPQIFIHHLSRPFRVIYVFINETQGLSLISGVSNRLCVGSIV